MLFSTTSRQRLGILATACLLSVALPAGTAFAQKTKTKDAPAAETSAPAPAPITTVDVEIPTIEAVGSNVDDETLRAIFSGAVVENADALAGLTATSITIPEIILDTTATIDGETSTASIVFSDVELTDVTDGIAASITLSGISTDAGDDGTAELGAVSASAFNIGGVLGLYGLVESDQTELETIYSDFSFEGGTLEAPEINCTIGAVTVAELKARPLRHSFAEIIALSETLEDTEMPPPETVGALLRMYVDLFTAFESSPSEFGGFSCTGTDDEDQKIDFSIASMSMGGMSPGIYPSIAMNGLDITVEGDGTVQIGNLTVKEMDFSQAIATVEAAPEGIDEAWSTANARNLTPAFGGFSVSDVVVDVPDPDVDGERIAASIGAFDLALGAYLNGIPTDLLMKASNIVVDLPTDTDDEQLQQLLALGITNVDAGFTVDASWNEAEDLINIDEISMTGVDLASIALTGTIANATEAMFSLDENEALAAAMGVAISHLKLDITDSGLSDIILAAAAAEQGADPATLRPVFAGLAEGTVIGLLAGAAEAQKVGAALNSFVSGSAKYLSIEMTAKHKPGLGLMDFMAAESDPSSLIGKVTINATAK